jgi:hypothetical protein
MVAKTVESELILESGNNFSKKNPAYFKREFFVYPFSSR